MSSSLIVIGLLIVIVLCIRSFKTFMVEKALEFIDSKDSQLKANQEKSESKIEAIKNEKPILANTDEEKSDFWKKH